MLLRNGALAGGSTGQLQTDRQPLFEEGVTLVFRRWTALLLALDMQWGGKDSAQKAQDLYEHTISWFRNNKDHYADDLALILEDGMEESFNARLDDGSPYEVAKVLVLLHNEVLHGVTNRLDSLRQAAAAQASASMRETVDRDGAVMEGDDSSSESSSDDEEDAEGMDTSHDVPDTQQPEPKAGPTVDEEGFELVQRRKPRGRGARPNG